MQIAAPGEDLPGLLHGFGSGDVYNGTEFETKSGTSQAAALVSGAGVLVETRARALSLDCTGAQIATAITTGAAQKSEFDAVSVDGRFLKVPGAVEQVSNGACGAR